MVLTDLVVLPQAGYERAIKSDCVRSILLMRHRSTHETGLLLSEPTTCELRRPP